MKLGGALLAAALLGGGVAFAVGAVVDTGSTTTVVREVRDVSQPAPASFGRGGSGQSVQSIYREAAPGVVQILATVVDESNPLFGPQEGQRRAPAS